VGKSQKRNCIEGYARTGYHCQLGDLKSKLQSSTGADAAKIPTLLAKSQDRVDSQDFPPASMHLGSRNRYSGSTIAVLQNCGKRHMNPGIALTAEMRMEHNHAQTPLDPDGGGIPWPGSDDSAGRNAEL
jgi:hypothetical protein